MLTVIVEKVSEFLLPRHPKCKSDVSSPYCGPRVDDTVVSKQGKIRNEDKMQVIR
jgi:hypothetical protein